MSRSSHYQPSLALLGLAGLGLGGCEARLGDPESLGWLWLLPLLGLFFWLEQRSRRRALARLAAPRLLPHLAASVSVRRRRLKRGLVLVGLAALLLALAEPQLGYEWQEIHRQGVDLVVAFDVSRSMLAEDTGSLSAASRLDRARREVTDLLRAAKGDRIGLVAFAGSAVLECPLTLDYGALESFLPVLDPDLLPLPGSDLGAALRTALSAFARSSPTSSRAIVLVTDGEDHEGQAQAAAEEARRAGVKVFALGLGEVKGAPLPEPTGGFHRDAEGKMVLSRLDEASLRAIARRTGGAYRHATGSESALRALYLEAIRPAVEEQDQEVERRRRWHQRFPWFLGLAALCLGLEPLISERGGRASR
ncbi:MAG: VWA domain-containing protein [Thermoanaerobaculia bacterium]